MQGFISCGFGRGNPIPQSNRVGSEVVGYNGIYLPSQELFILPVGFVDNPNCKLVVDFVKGHILGLHFPSDGKSRLHTTLYLIIKPFLIQRIPNHIGKIFNIGQLLFLGIFNFGLNVIVYFRFGIFQTKVLQMGFDIVQAYSVSQRRIDVKGFRSNLHLLMFRHGIHGKHIVISIRNFDNDYPNIIMQGQQHFTEVFRLLTDVFILF